MAKKKGKKGVTDFVGSLGPAPTDLPKLTGVNQQLVQETKSKLAEARKEGKAAAKGQLASIAEQTQGKLGKQASKFDQRSDRIMRNMQRLNKESKLFNMNRRNALGVTQQQNVAAYGGRASGLTGPRRDIQRSQEPVIATQGRSAVQQGAKVQEAGQKALAASGRIDTASTKNSLSILDVLAAERRSDDVRFAQDQAFQLRMQQLQMDQSVYMAKLGNALQKDYMQWQYDQGYLETPDEKRANDFKYYEMEKRLENKLLDKRAGEEAGPYVRSALDVAEATIASANELYNAPGFHEAAKRNYQAAKAAGKPTTLDRERLNLLREGTITSPPEQFAGLYENILGHFVETGTTPTFTEVQSYVQNNDETGAAAKVFTNNPALVDQVHQSYRAVNAATIGVEQYKDVITGEMISTGIKREAPPPTGGGEPEGSPGVSGWEYALGGAAVAGGVAGGVKFAQGRRPAPGKTTGTLLDSEAHLGPRPPITDRIKARVARLVRSGVPKDEAARLAADASDEIADVVAGGYKAKASRGIVSPFGQDIASEISRELDTLAEADLRVAETFADPARAAEDVAGAGGRVRGIGDPVPQKALGTGQQALPPGPTQRALPAGPSSTAGVEPGSVNRPARAGSRYGMDAFPADYFDEAAQVTPMDDVEWDRFNQERERKVQQAIQEEAKTAKPKTKAPSFDEINESVEKQFGKGKWIKFDDGTVARTAGDVSDNVLKKAGARIVSKATVAKDAAMASRAAPVLKVAGGTLKIIGRVAGPVGIAAEVAFGSDLPFWESPARTAGAETDIPGAGQILDARREAESLQEDVWHDTARQFLGFSETALEDGRMSPKDFLEFVKQNSIDQDDSPFNEDERWRLYQVGVKALRAYYDRRNGS